MQLQALLADLPDARPVQGPLIAGKGHEPYLIVGTEYLPWDGREVARAELALALALGVGS